MNVLATVALNILLKLDWTQAIEAVKRLIFRRLPAQLDERIDQLVIDAETSAAPGSRFDWVREQLVDPASPVRVYAQTSAQHLVNLAIEAAVARLHARNG